MPNIFAIHNISGAIDPDEDGGVHTIIFLHPAMDTETQQGAGRDQSFYPQIPFSSQPQFREPINQGLWEKNKSNFSRRNSLEHARWTFRASRKSKGHFFQEKEAATETPNGSVKYLVVGAPPSRPLNLFIEKFNAQSSQLCHSKDEGSHRHRAKVISQGSLEGFPTVGVGQTWIILVF